MHTSKYQEKSFAREVICKMSEAELPSNTRENLFKHDQWPINTWNKPEVYTQIMVLET